MTTVIVILLLNVGLLLYGERFTPKHVRAFMEDFKTGEAMGRGWTNFYRVFDQGQSEFHTNDSDWILELDAPGKAKGILVVKTADTWKGDLLKGGRL